MVNGASDNNLRQRQLSNFKNAKENSAQTENNFLDIDIYNSKIRVR